MEYSGPSLSSAPVLHAESLSASNHLTGNRPDGTSLLSSRASAVVTTHFVIRKAVMTRSHLMGTRIKMRQFIFTHTSDGLSPLAALHSPCISSAWFCAQVLVAVNNARIFARTAPRGLVTVSVEGGQPSSVSQSWTPLSGQARVVRTGPLVPIPSCRVRRLNAARLANRSMKVAREWRPCEIVEIGERNAALNPSDCTDSRVAIRALRAASALAYGIRAAVLRSPRPVRILQPCPARR